jgi:hypothetical protein
MTSLQMDWLTRIQKRRFAQAFHTLVESSGAWQSGLSSRLRRVGSDLAGLASQLPHSARQKIAAAHSVRPAAVFAIAAPPGRLDSLIVSEFAPSCEEFDAKRFNLLWRATAKVLVLMTSATTADNQTLEL